MGNNSELKNKNKVRLQHCNNRRSDGIPHEKLTPHTCPRKSELYDNKELCTCCRSCTQLCYEEI